MDALTPLLPSVITLTVEMKNLREDLSHYIHRADTRDAEASEDRRSFRRWAIGLAVMLVCAIIAAVAAIIASHH